MKTAIMSPQFRILRRAAFAPIRRVAQDAVEKAVSSYISCPPSSRAESSSKRTVSPVERVLNFAAEIMYFAVPPAFLVIFPFSPETAFATAFAFTCIGGAFALAAYYL